jgi:hypothetical protein
LFRKTDSPCIAMMSVFTQILKQKDMYPEAYKTITTASLVDNMADSRPTTQQIGVLINELSDFFPKHCAMYIRKFVVNDKELMLKIPHDDRLQALKEDNLVEDILSGKLEQPGVKILGISWNYITDQMYFDFSTLISTLVVSEKILAKLILLSILHSLYDPLGVLIPFTIIGKLAMQLCWKLGLSRKAKLPQEVLDIWQPWASKIQQLNGYSFERTLIPGENPERENQQIHVFVDASQDTYAAVAYMRSENRGKVSVRFIQARSRIKPVKATHTIPRMELLSIELGLSMLRKLRTTFDISAHDVFIWTDSRACHDWIRIEARSLQIFVKNRVLKIRQYLKLDQVRWLPGAINPADAATRGITVAELRDH